VFENRIALLLAALVVLAAGPALAQTVQVPRSIPFAENADVREKVKDECALQTKIPTFLAEFSDSVELVDGAPATSGRSLQIEITAVHAPGGGAFSGPKSVSVKGTLMEDGQAIGDFRATRYSGGGVFGGYKGTCAVAGRCAKAIGKDVAGWLANPSKGALLGDAK